MENIQIAAKYLKEKHKWPILKGHRICMKPDTRRKHKKRSPTSVLKVHSENIIEKYKSNESLNYTETSNNDN